MKGNKSELEELVRRAQKKKATAPPVDNKQNAMEVEAKPKTCAKETFRNASVPTNTNLATSHVASEDALWSWSR